MSIHTKRAIAAASTVVLAAAANVITVMLTQRWALAWWAATIVLVVLGAGLQAWLTVSDRPGRATSVTAGGVGAIAAANDVIGASTDVTLRSVASAPSPPPPPPGNGVSAPGIGAAASGGDARDVHTKVTEEDPTAP